MLENQVCGKEKGGHFLFKFYSIIIICIGQYMML